ncbi:MAG: diadenylate cyclase [Acholeplasmatales bacterium]|nr:diadenylate cyclase [Acholeplasmatales bacterium]
MFQEFLQNIKNFFDNNLIATIIFDGWLSLMVISIVVLLALKFRKALSLAIIGVLLLAFWWVAKLLDLSVSLPLYTIATTNFVVICVVIMAPELRKMMEMQPKSNQEKALIVSPTQATIEAVSDAVFNMASIKVGALITFEQHYSLEQYSERAISLNADVSRELLEQIFIKDSPLHDGGVIIRGNKIICAAAYYTLTQVDLDKTIGSRHRAGIGISEITDSLTVIVSEETGDVHVANSGFMKIMSNKNELIEYLSTYLGKTV